MSRPRRVSQQSIARDLGVSQALVSLTLNGQKERISPETYKRIWDYAIQAGYQPKGIRLENSPHESRTRQIGVILRAGINLHSQGSYFSHVLHGLNSALLELGYTTALLGSEGDTPPAKLAPFFGPTHAIRAVVLLGEVSSPFLQSLRELTSTIVAVSARHPGLCHSVVGNEPQALDSLVDHLQQLGHSRIGWLGGNAGLARHEKRYHAFKTSLAASGLKHYPRYDVKRPEGDRSEGAEAMISLLPHRPRRDFPTAFVTYNIHMAIGATRALQREGLHVPADFSIVAADFSEAADRFTPQITAAGCDPVELGRSAANLALDQLDRSDGAYHDLIIASRFHTGATSGHLG